MRSQEDSLCFSGAVAAPQLAAARFCRRVAHGLHLSDRGIGSAGLDLSASPLSCDRAETFAPVAECALFYALFHDGRGWRDPSVRRDLGVLVLANLASFRIRAVVVRLRQALSLRL